MKKLFVWVLVALLCAVTVIPARAMETDKPWSRVKTAMILRAPMRAEVIWRAPVREQSSVGSIADAPEVPEEAEVSNAPEVPEVSDAPEEAEVPEGEATPLVIFQIGKNAVPRMGIHCDAAGNCW